MARINKDSTAVDNTDEGVSETEFVGINLEKIMKNPGSKYDLYLEEGDLLRIPRQLQTVKVQGEVLYPISVRYVAGKSLKYYVSQSGGFSQVAKRSKSYVINPNGSVNSTGKILFFNSYPKVNPGAQIVVPQKAETKGPSTQEVLGITTAISSMALITITIVNMVKK